MITLVGTWEHGWLDPEVESFMWKQLIKAYQVDRVIFSPTKLKQRSYPEQAETMEDSLNMSTGKRVFLIPGQGESLVNYNHPNDAVYIFGNAMKSNQDLVTKDDDVVNIPTPDDIDFFAINAVAITLYDRKIKNVG
jgi:hypothetical protein